MANMKHIVRSWTQADLLYKVRARRPRHGGRPRVNLGYATWLRLIDDPRGEPDYAVRFHATDVVTFHSDGSITLATDGWLTKTTSDRITDYTPPWLSVRTRNIPRGRGEKEFWIVTPNESWDMAQEDYVTFPAHLPSWTGA